MSALRSIVLIGFMGSGKSSVGRLLAQRPGYRFMDTDRLVIQAAAGREISAIFAEEGEAAFRRREREALLTLRGEPGLILATGGGIVTVPENVLLLRELGFVVWLTATEQVIWDRVSRNDKRPLLRTANPRETIRTLLTSRNPQYEEIAALKVDTSLLSHTEVAEQIWSALEKED